MEEVMEFVNMDNKQVRPKHFWSLTNKKIVVQHAGVELYTCTKVEVWNNGISEVFLNHIHIWQQLSVSRTAVLREKCIVISHLTLSSTHRFT
jgi:hypothetical protein